MLFSQRVCREGGRGARIRWPLVAHKKKQRNGICTNVLTKRSGFQWQPLRRERIFCDASLHCDGGEREREPSVGFNTRVVHEYIKTLYSSRRLHGERREGRCSTQEENDVGMERACGDGQARRHTYEFSVILMGRHTHLDSGARLSRGRNRLWPSLSDRLWPNRLWPSLSDRL